MIYVARKVNKRQAWLPYFREVTIEEAIARRRAAAGRPTHQQQLALRQVRHQCRFEEYLARRLERAAASATGGRRVRLRMFAERKQRTGARPTHAEAAWTRSRSDREVEAIERAELVFSGVYEARPRTWGECAPDDGPCPWVSCKHHLFLSVDPITGKITVNFPDKEPWELEETCALRVVEANPGGLSLERIGELTNISQEWVRQIERGALEEMRGEMEDDEED